MKKFLISSILISSNTLLLIGAILSIFNISFAVYIFAIGAIAGIVPPLQVIGADKQENKRNSRLFRIHLMVSLMPILGTYFMYNDSNSWVIALLIYALTTLFLSTRIDK